MWHSSFKVMVEKHLFASTYSCRIDRMLVLRYMHNRWGKSLCDRRYCKARGFCL